MAKITMLYKKLKTINLELVVLATTLIVIGVIFVFKVPLGYGNDEPVHAYKAYSTSQGQIIPELLGPWTTLNGDGINVYGGRVPKALYESEQSGNYIKLNSPCTETNCLKPDNHEKETASAVYQTPINSSPEQLVDFWGANSYSPIGYLPSAIGFGIAKTINTSVENTVQIGRLFNLVIASIIIIGAFWILINYRSRWIIFAASLLPFSIISFSSLGIDGILLAVCILFVSCLARIILEKKTPNRIVVLLIISALIIPLLKLPYIIISFLALFLPLRLSKAKKTLLAAIIILPAFGWNILTADATRTQSLTVYAGKTPPNTTLQLKSIVREPRNAVRALSSSLILSSPITGVSKVTQQPGLNIPEGITIVSFMILLLSVFISMQDFVGKKLSMKFPLLIIASAMLVYLGVILSMYLTYNPVGATQIAGVQGRYFIPLYSLMAVGIASLYPIRISATRSAVKYVYVFSSSALALATAVWYWLIVY